MKRRLIVAAYIIIGVVLFKLAFSYGYNEWVISKYEEEDYSENFNLLEVANVNEPYIAYYNNGNVMYRLEDYRRAIEYYEKALEYVLPEGKECPIRINLALAKLALMDPDYMAREHIDESLHVGVSLARVCTRARTNRSCCGGLLSVFSFFASFFHFYLSFAVMKYL